MSTEAMRKAHEREKAAYGYIGKSLQWQTGFDSGFKEAWQAATANQDALIRAAVEACAKLCDERAKNTTRLYETADPAVGESIQTMRKHRAESALDCRDTIRQMTPEQILNSTK